MAATPSIPRTADNASLRITGTILNNSQDISQLNKI